MSNEASPQTDELYGARANAFSRVHPSASGRVGLRRIRREEERGEVEVFAMSGLRSSTGGDKIAPKYLTAEAVEGPEGPMTTGAHDDCTPFGCRCP